MERQRSLSFKPTRLLMFSFTIFSSAVFFTSFSIWVLKAKPPFQLERRFQFNKASLCLGLKRESLQTLTGFCGNFSEFEVKNAILTGTHVEKLGNVSLGGNISRFEELPRKESGSEVLDDAKIGVNGLNGNFSATSVVESVLIRTHFDRPENSSGFPQKTVFSNGIRRNDNNSVLKYGGKHVSETSFGKSEVGIEEKSRGICDVTNGKWIFDESYPLYTNGSCPFIDEGFNCEGNGRLDNNYMKWRWQPKDCDIPRFNATKMLELIRGKRLVFVGDSLNRNQWESMLCMLMTAIKDPKRVYETHRRKITKEKGNYSFKFVDYQCTVEYYVTHFLVHESKARLGRKRVQTLRIDTIDRGSSRWKGADILIFNTAHWWNHYKTKAGINYYQEGDQVHPRLKVSTAFQRSLLTWASWVDKYINPRKTQVFFRSSAPSHFSGGQWNSGGHCREATQPLNEISSIRITEKNIVVEDVIKQMRTPVTVLNVTGMSQYRIDGHPSVYGRKSGKGYSSVVQDCSHWCLPGVPDSWNELLYFHLQWKR